MTQYIGMSGLYARLAAACAEAGGQSKWAMRHGISISQISEIANAHRDPTAKVLAALGLRREVRYAVVEPVENEINKERRAA